MPFGHPEKFWDGPFWSPPNRYSFGSNHCSSRLLVIKSPDFYDLVHDETKMGIKIMDNLAQVVT